MKALGWNIPEFYLISELVPSTLRFTIGKLPSGGSFVKFSGLSALLACGPARSAGTWLGLIIPLGIVG